MNYHLIFRNAFLIILIMFISSCSYTVEEAETVIEESCPPTSFSATIKPIIDNNCVECHNGNQFPNLSAFSGISQNANIVKRVVSDRSMPIGGGTLTQEQIDAIVCWVDNGALNN